MLLLFQWCTQDHKASKIMEWPTSTMAVKAAGYYMAIAWLRSWTRCLEKHPGACVHPCVYGCMPKIPKGRINGGEGKMWSFPMGVVGCFLTFTFFSSLANTLCPLAKNFKNKNEKYNDGASLRFDSKSHALYTTPNDGDVFYSSINRPSSIRVCNTLLLCSLFFAFLKKFY